MMSMQASGGYIHEVWAVAAWCGACVVILSTVIKSAGDEPTNLIDDRRHSGMWQAGRRGICKPTTETPGQTDEMKRTEFEISCVVCYGGNVVVINDVCMYE